MQFEYLIPKYIFHLFSDFFLEQVIRKHWTKAVFPTDQVAMRGFRPSIQFVDGFRSLSVSVTFGSTMGGMCGKLYCNGGAGIVSTNEK